MKYLALLAFCPLLYNASQAQNNTQASWQQQTDYRIEVKLDDSLHCLSAYEQVSYTNNSPYSLKEIYFHLWPNAYKNGGTAFARQKLESGNLKFHFSEEADRGYIDSLDFKVDGERVSWQLLKGSIDICRIELKNPLAPGASILISTPFKVKIPKVFSRMGHEGQFYAATQWYPKPAVFDVNGWNHMPYLDIGEFYSEFGSFEVKITVPQNYVVAASGELQEESEKIWLDSLSDLPQGPWWQGGVLNKKIYKEEMEKRKLFPPSSPAYKTLTYKLDKAHDFAWFADKRFFVAKSSIRLASGRLVNTWAFSPKEKPKHATPFINDAVKFYSENVGEYPYSICQAVDGPLSAGGGMEYPTITICAGLNEQVVLHEVGHNWFYGILGSNERMHAWMDEGINSFYEKDFYAGKPFLQVGGRRDPFDLKTYPRSHESELLYLYTARKYEDQPLEIPSWEYADLNYGTVVYAKTPVLFRHLRGYLGKEVFDSCMKTYYEQWKFRHPLPADIRNVFEKTSGKNLGWFFDDYFKGTDKLDYKLLSYKKQQDGSVTIKLKNKGDLHPPFSISTVSDGQVVSTQWYEGFSGRQEVNFKYGVSEHYELDAKREMPEFYRKNNYLRSKGLFKRCGPLRIQLFGSLEHPYKKQLFISPLIGYNIHNRFMPGLMFYNTLIPQKKLEYEFVPLYSPATNDLNGYLDVRRNWSSNKSRVHSYVLGYHAARFRTVDFGGVRPMYYLKQAPYLKMIFKKASARSTVSRELKLRYVSVYEEQDAEGMDYELQYFTSRFWQAGYTWDNQRKLNPMRLRLSAEEGKDFYNRYIKSSLEWTNKINLGKPKKHLDVRVFGGMMNFSRETGGNSGRYYLRMSGNTTFFDYTYDQVLMGRSASSGSFSQQILMRDGGFKTLPGIGASNQWLAAMNLKCDIPGILPIRMYLDAGTYSGAATAYPGSQAVMYNAGVLVSIYKGTFEMYFPAFASKDIKQAWELNNISYGERITFTLHLNALNPLWMIRNISL